MALIESNNSEMALQPIAGGALEVSRAGLQPIDRQPAAVYLAGLAEGSRRSMRQALDVIAGLLSGGRETALSLDWAGLRYQHTQAIRSRLEEAYAPASANKILSALRGALKEAWRLGLVESEDYTRAVDLKPVKGERLPKGRALTAGELRALFSQCQADSSVTARRDAALLACLYGGGLRRSEAVSLDVSDFDAESGALKIRAGKGNKDRLVYLAEGGRRALEAWLSLRGSGSGPLFLPVNKGGKIISRRLTSQAIFEALRERALKAGVKGFSPHDMRRSFISDLLDAGADIVTVQKLAGHSKPETTARYDRRGEETKRKAAELLHVPF